MFELVLELLSYLLCSVASKSELTKVKRVLTFISEPRFIVGRRLKLRITRVFILKASSTAPPEHQQLMAESTKNSS